MMQFKEFMASSKVPFQLQARRELQARRFEMLDKLSPWLRKELTVHINKGALTQHPFFRDMPDELLPHVCISAVSVLCAPGDLVLQTGQNTRSMYFLVRGKLQVNRQGTTVAPQNLGGVQYDGRMDGSSLLTAPGFICAD